jgi:nucleotide-binding universal stress UspA family protein
MPEVSSPKRSLYQRVVVPLDGSSFAEMALEVARQAGACFDARIDLTGFGVADADQAALEQRLVETAAAYPDAHIWTGVERDTAEGIVEAAGDDEDTLVCMASHARHGVAGALLRSVALGVLSRGSAPVLLVGPSYEPSRRLGSGPVLVTVDGTPESQAALSPAAAWASRLGVGLRIVTVAEPVPPPLTGHHTLRHHGPSGDPEAYVEGLASAVRTPDLAVTATVLYDPVGVAGALCDHAGATGASLIVMVSKPRAGSERALLGSTAMGVLHDSPVPVLVVARPESPYDFVVEHPAVSEAVNTIVHGLGSSGI